MPCVAVVDVETTGINPYRHDRIIEIAAVVMRPDGMVLREFATLVNPERDIGPTSKHGLTARDLLHAPRFAEIAGELLEVLDGSAAFAGHNVRFDHSFLAMELRRLGHQCPEGPTLCTLQLAGGGNLLCCCADFGIEFDGPAHAALHDARATARLLSTLLADAPHMLWGLHRMPPIAWPTVPKSSRGRMTRVESLERQNQRPSYLERLLSRAHSLGGPEADDTSALAYVAVLDAILEDRRVDEDEADSLLEVATRWGMSGPQIHNVHRGYLETLATAALADGIVTDAERRDLKLVSHLLGIEDACLEEVLTRSAPTRPVPLPASENTQSLGEDLSGRRVCFTGELQCRLKGVPITRDMATEMARERGMVVVESVTKKLDLLVVADPFTQSGKGKKARQYGIRIMHEPVFWKAIGADVD